LAVAGCLSVSRCAPEDDTLARQERRTTGASFRTTPFPSDGRASRVARLLVLDMVLWPGALFIGGSVFLAWQVRDHPVSLVALLVATLFSAAVGVRQWRVMLGAVFEAVPSRAELHQSPAKEVPPRLTGRGGTADPR
jgi:hypothetical protein